MEVDENNIYKRAECLLCADWIYCYPYYIKYSSTLVPAPVLEGESGTLNTSINAGGKCNVRVTWGLTVFCVSFLFQKLNKLMIHDMTPVRRPCPMSFYMCSPPMINLKVFSSPSGWNFQDFASFFLLLKIDLTSFVWAKSSSMNHLPIASCRVQTHKHKSLLRALLHSQAAHSYTTPEPRPWHPTHSCTNSSEGYRCDLVANSISDDYHISITVHRQTAGIMSGGNWISVDTLMWEIGHVAGQ